MKKLIISITAMLPTLLYSQCGATINVTGSVCYGDCSGFIQAIGYGAAPIEYSWSSGDSTSIIANACQGLYLLTITDDNGCVASFVVSVDGPPEFDVSLDVLSGSSDSGNCDALVQESFNGGVPPYNYYGWYDCEGDSLIGLIVDQPINLYLCAGEFALIGVDNNGCKDTSECITITNPVASIMQESHDFNLLVQGRNVIFPETIKNIKVFGVNGSLLFEQQTAVNQFYLPEASVNGVYFISFESLTNMSYVKKIYLEN